VAKIGREHFGAYFHPKRKDWIYMTCFNRNGGLYLSKDSGKTFTQFKGLPFGGPTRVCFDPTNDDVIYVATFGGSVWRGPAAE
jgi:hypothetical protein